MQCVERQLRMRDGQGDGKGRVGMKQQKAQKKKREGLDAAR